MHICGLGKAYEIGECIDVNVVCVKDRRQFDSSAEITWRDFSARVRLNGAYSALILIVSLAALMINFVHIVIKSNNTKVPPHWF